MSDQHTLGMSIREEQADRTRAALTSAARRLFMERGYAKVGTEEIVLATGLTRGALYHHFGSKLNLFRAVFEEVCDEMSAIFVSRMVQFTSPYEALAAGIAVYLDSCEDPRLARLLLLDAPTALGWPHWREIQENRALGLLDSGFAMAMELGEIRRQPTASLAHIWFASMSEGALLIANSDNPSVTRGEVERIYLDWLASLR